MTRKGTSKLHSEQYQGSMKGAHYETQPLWFSAMEKGVSQVFHGLR